MAPILRRLLAERRLVLKQTNILLPTAEKPVRLFGLAILPWDKCTTRPGRLNLYFDALYADGDDAASTRFNERGPGGIPFLYKGELYISAGPGQVNSVHWVDTLSGKRELDYGPACIFQVR